MLNDTQVSQLIEVSLASTEFDIGNSLIIIGYKTESRA